jgi:hypothetical protein
VSFKYAGREKEDRRAAGRAFHASMLLKKKAKRSLFVALIGFCKYMAFQI